MHPRTSKNKVQFEELFFSYHKKVYAYAYKKTNSPYIAEETVQRVFIKLWDNLEHKEVHVDINAQVFCITRTVLLDILKQENRRRLNLQEYSITDSYPSPTEIFSAKELKHQLDQHIEAMPHMRRKVFQLSRYENLKHAEIASMLKISTKTVENHIRLALKTLRNTITMLLFFILFV